MTIVGTDRLADRVNQNREAKAEQDKNTTDHTDIINLLTSRVDQATEAAKEAVRDVFTNLEPSIRAAHERGEMKDFMSETVAHGDQKIAQQWPIGDSLHPNDYDTIQKSFVFWPNDLHVFIGIAENFEADPEKITDHLNEALVFSLKNLDDNAKRIKKEIQSDKHLLFLVELTNEKDSNKQHDDLTAFLQAGRRTRFERLKEHHIFPSHLYADSILQSIAADVKMLASEGQKLRQTPKM